MAERPIEGSNVDLTPRLEALAELDAALELYDLQLKRVKRWLLLLVPGLAFYFAESGVVGVILFWAFVLFYPLTRLAAARMAVWDAETLVKETEPL